MTSYYITCRRGAQVRFVRGPFPTHAASLQALHETRRAIGKLDPSTDFDFWGTARRTGPSVATVWGKVFDGA